MMLRRLCVSAFFLAFLALLPASGSTLTVTSTSDSGSGSLRAALAAAAPGDTINFSLTLSPATITLASTLTVSTNVTITGPGVSSLAISGNNAVSVFNISQGLTVSISGLTIENGKSFGGSGIYILGGTLTLDNVAISNNSTPYYGAGIYNYSATVTLTNCTVSSNSATEYGGGIYNLVGTVNFNDSTLSNNSTMFYGGGVYNYGGTLNFTNSTVAGNTSSYYAGALWNSGFGTVTATSTTFYGNTGSYGGGIDNSPNSTVTIKNSLLANSTGGNYMSFGGTALSNGYNLSDDASGASFLTGTGDHNSVAAGLDPKGLQNNGGATQTVALVSGSTAIDAVPVAACTRADGTALTTDQRGVTRPQGSACDIGAFELAQSAVFSSFNAKLDMHGGSQGAFDLNATFTLAAGSSGIDPLTQAVQLQIGPYNVTIPAGSFHQLTRGEKQGSYVFEGMINGTMLAVQIVPLGGNSYQLKAAGAPVDFGSLAAPVNTADPVNVTLTIDKNTGTTSVQAWSHTDDDNWDPAHSKHSKHDRDHDSGRGD